MVSVFGSVAGLPGCGLRSDPLVTLKPLAQLHGVRAAHSQISKQGESQARLCADRMMAFELGNLVIGPSVPALSGTQAFLVTDRIDVDVASLLRPRKQGTLVPLHARGEEAGC